jgi:glycerophosphoryl diester phosphodiesterase
MQKPQFPPIPKLIAHRGASMYYPENTITALRMAHSMGARWVEFDVRFAGNNVPVIFHDKTLERTTNGHGYVVTTPFHHLEQLDAGAWFDRRFAHEKIPSFKEWLQCAAELKMGMVIELKARRWRAARLADTVLKMLDDYWPKDLPTPVLSSASFTCLRELYRCNKELPLGLVIKHWFYPWRQVLQECNCVSAHLRHSVIKLKRVEYLKKLGYKVLAYTVNDLKVANILFEHGVDAIFSDNPRLLNM